MICHPPSMLTQIQTLLKYRQTDQVLISHSFSWNIKYWVILNTFFSLFLFCQFLPFLCSQPLQTSRSALQPPTSIPHCPVGRFAYPGSRRAKPTEGELESRWHLLVPPMSGFLFTPVSQCMVLRETCWVCSGSAGVSLRSLLPCLWPLSSSDLFAHFFCHTTMGAYIWEADPPPQFT